MVRVEQAQNSPRKLNEAGLWFEHHFWNEEFNLHLSKTVQSDYIDEDWAFDVIWTGKGELKLDYLHQLSIGVYYEFDEEMHTGEFDSSKALVWKLKIHQDLPIEKHATKFLCLPETFIWRRTNEDIIDIPHKKE